MATDPGLQELHNHDELLRNVAAGDHQAFRLLFDTYRPRVYSFAFAHSRSEVLADEITQEVFIKIWSAGQKLTEILVFEAWLKTVTRNLVYSQLRKLKTERAVITDLIDNINTSYNTTEQTLALNEASKRLSDALAQLTEQQRVIFRMSREENMSYAAIAAALGISEHTVNYHIKTILRHLRTVFGDRLDLLLVASVALF